MKKLFTILIITLATIIATSAFAYAEDLVLSGDDASEVSDLSGTIELESIENYNFEYSCNTAKTRYFVTYSDLEEDVDFKFTYSFSNGYVTVKFTGIGDYTGVLTNRTKATYVNYRKTSVSLYPYDTTKPELIVNHPRTGTTSYTSSNISVATVSTGGTITAKSPGTAYVTMKNNGVSDKIKVVVKAPKLSATSVKLRNSNGKTIKYLGGKGDITWKSSNTTVATVNSKGYVKGKKAGTCYIYGTRNGKKLKCSVKVYLGNDEYHSIPDFGAYIGKFRVVWENEDGLYMAGYKATYSQKTQYEKKIKNAGFAYSYKEDGGKIYVNNNFDCVFTYYEKGYVFIGYTNIFDLPDEANGASRSTMSIDNYDYGKIADMMKASLR